MNRGRAVLALGSVLAGLEWQRGRPLNSVVRWHVTAFSISDAAGREVRYRLESSDLANPVASLYDGCGAFPASSEIVEAISRKASDAEMLEIAKREHTLRVDKLDFRLDVGVYLESQCRPEDLVLIGGLQFAMPKEMLGYFDGYILDFANGAFVLRNGERIYVRLADLGKSESAT